MYSICFCWYSLNSCGFFLFHVLNAYIVSTSSVVIVTASLVTPGSVCAACLDVFCGLCVNNAPENLCDLGVQFAQSIRANILEASQTSCVVSSGVGVPSDPVPGEPLQRRPTEAHGQAHDLYSG